MHGALHLHAFRRSRIASIAASFGPDLGKKLIRIVLGVRVISNRTRVSLGPVLSALMKASDMENPRRFQTLQQS
jgi:hypothetical protein